MDFLKNEIALKRKLHQEAQEQASKAKISKLSDDSAILASPVVAFTKESNDITSTANGQVSPKATTDDAPDDELTIPEEEIRKRFRQYGEPVLLFAETNANRIDRLKKLESFHLEMLSSHHTSQVKAYYFYASAYLVYSSVGFSGKVEDTGKSRAKVEQLKKFVAQHKNEFANISLHLLEADRSHCYTLIYAFFQNFLFEWEEELEGRDEPLKLSGDGKLETTAFKQSSENMKPFFKLLKHKSMEGDVEKRIADICYWIQRRDYVKANDAYIRLSIGNACWPIGVTMVGIHERKSRDRITENQVAHVLNDETQRKWIQSIKRLMTFAQKKYPPSDHTKAMG